MLINLPRNLNIYIYIYTYSSVSILALLKCERCAQIAIRFGLIPATVMAPKARTALETIDELSAGWRDDPSLNGWGGVCRHGLWVGSCSTLATASLLKANRIKRKNPLTAEDIFLIWRELARLMAPQRAEENEQIMF